MPARDTCQPKGGIVPERKGLGRFVVRVTGEPATDSWVSWETRYVKHAPKRV